MAIAKVLLQGLCVNDDHESALIHLLSDQSANKFLLSMAYARSSGVDLLSSYLTNVQDKVSIYVGIANGVTSIQAIKAMLFAGIKPFVVNVGTARKIYHPKVYASFHNDSVKVIIGSANLTFSGMNDNIEASSEITLFRNNLEDSEYISKLENAFFNMHNNYSSNVSLINNIAEAESLLFQGLLEDESICSSAIVLGRSHSSISNATPVFPSINARPKLPKAIPAKQFTPNINLGMVWKSKELRERDLNVPTGTNTNATGSMFFNKGMTQNIDQRHYFRDVVFGGLSWNSDPKPSKSHLERAVASFEIIINGVSQGKYELSLTHNSLTNTATYLQNNSMTQVHWGSARGIIADRRLLGKYMTLYHLGADCYQMSID